VKFSLVKIIQSRTHGQIKVKISVLFVPEGSVSCMARSIEDLEKDLNTMNEMFRKYVKLSSHYQKQIDNADIPEEQRNALLEKLEEENEKVQQAKLQIEKFEQTIQALKQSRAKLKDVSSRDDKVDYLVAYN